MAAETDALRRQVRRQLERLVRQMEDLEECRREGDLEVDEYEEEKADTLKQMEEFQGSLSRMQDSAGDGGLTLVDELGAMQLAIQAAISSAFQTPDVIKFFAKRDTKQLRARLEELTAVAVLGSGGERHSRESAEILTALRKLGDALSDAETAFLAAAENADVAALFDQASLDVKR